MVARRSLLGGQSLTLLLFFFWVSMLTPESLAEPSDQKPSDVRIVIDISGSMKQTDPNNLRTPALNLLVELLPDGAQSGVWTFGRYVNMLVPHGNVDQAWREKAKSSAVKINSVGLQTNLVDALDKSFWKIAPDSGFDHSVILLTDGRIDMVEPGADASVNVTEKARLLNQVLPKYIAAGAKIHTLALSGAADVATLQQISLETGGLFLEAKNAEQLLKAFLKAFDRAVPVEQVPMTNNAFEIDGSVSEFTALIFRTSTSKETTLIAPDGRVVSQKNSVPNGDVRWHRDINFDLITVRGPQVGSWKADADIDPDNRVQILTDLKLNVSGLPSSIFAGYPIHLEIALTEKNEVLNEKAILELTDFALKVTAPDMRTGSKLLSDPESLPEDGVFRESLTRLSQRGEYQVEITASGRTFQRRQVLSATLMEPLEVSTEADYDNQTLNVYVTPQLENVDTSLSRVIARISSPDGSSVIHSMTFDRNRNAWHLALVADKGEGLYEALLNIRGVTSNGSTFKSKPESIVAEFPLVNPAEKVEPIEMRQQQESESSADHRKSEKAHEEPVEPVAQAMSDEPEAGDESEVNLQANAEMTSDTEAAPEAEVTPEAEAKPQPEVEIKPDLAKKFEQQVDQTANTEDLTTEEGIAWWVYLILALGNLAVFGGAGYWWFKKRKPAAVADEPNSSEKPASSDLPPDLEAEFDDADLDGDFDAFSEEGEKEITPAAAPPGANLGPAADDGLGLDDDFSIDPDDLESDLGGDDDWGEFDTPDDGAPGNGSSADDSSADGEGDKK